MLTLSGGRGSGGSKGKGGKGRRGGRLSDTNFNKQSDISAVYDPSINEATEKDRELIDKARTVASKTLSKSVNPSGKVQLEADTYQKLYTAVAKEISQLRVILEQAEAKEKERVWLKNQQFGELDDNKLIDGVTGEKNIYKKRGTEEPLFGRLQKKPKRIRFVMDVSGSERLHS